MEIRTYPIDIRKSKTFTLLPFSCLHWGNPACHLDLFKEFCLGSHNPYTYTVGLGDYIEFSRTTYRQAVGRVHTGENSHEGLDRMVVKHLEEGSAILRLLNINKCLGLIEGNHRWDFLSNIKELGIYPSLSSTEWFSKALNIPYLGHTALINLDIRVTDSIRDSYVLFLNHGHGFSGGRSAGDDLNYIERKIESAFQADAYITAHTHRILAYNLPTLKPSFSNNILKEDSKLIVKAGSFYKGYLPSEYTTTYAEKKLYRPLNLGWCPIRLSYTKNNNNVWERQVETSLSSFTTL